MDIKNRIKIALRKNKILYGMNQYLYTIVFHRNRLMSKKHYGDCNKEKQILLIRPNAEDNIQGLMSLFIQAMRWVDYANANNMIAYIDYKNYPTQYSNGIDNAWDYYFTQPSKLSIEEVYSSANVTISGVSLRHKTDLSLFTDQVFFDSKICNRCHDIISNNIRYSRYIIDILDTENTKIEVQNCVGLYIRGTDYAKLKPIGEHIQPNIEQFYEVVENFIRKHDNDLFLVTEDYQYYKFLKDKYGERLKIVSFDSFVMNYANGYLSESGTLNNDLRRRGADYLVKILLLSKCKYLISSITMGSIAAYSLNGGVYEDSYIFDLGIYK